MSIIGQHELPAAADAVLRAAVPVGAEGTL